MVSMPLVRLAGGTPSATAAFHSRAPSRWTDAPCSWAMAASSAVSAGGMTTPPANVWVFSRTSRSIRGARP